MELLRQKAYALKILTDTAKLPTKVFLQIDALNPKHVKYLFPHTLTNTGYRQSLIF